jgi:hypothetical protein
MYDVTKHNINDIESISDFPLLKYINNKQYIRHLNSKIYFYLIFELSKKNRKFLLKVIQDCLENVYFCGIIFIIDKNEILFDRLFFLRDIVLKLFQNGKKAGIWGIPYCVEQLIFGSYTFSQLSSRLIPEEGTTYCKYIPNCQFNSSLLLSCSQCIAFDKCDGLGRLADNHSMWGYRTSQEYRKRGRDKLFGTENIELQKMYHDFCAYIDSSDLTYADRYLYFVKNIDFGSLYSFSNRFVYHCDFLPPYEYNKELAFLDIYVQNKSFLSIIDELAKKGEIGRIAYSKADKSKISRESFYIIPNNEYNMYLLKYFNIDFDAKFPNKFYGVGVDFYNGQIKSYKVYFMVSSEILLKMHPSYLSKIDIDLMNLESKEHYYIVRLDAKKKQVSERIDLVYNEKNRLLFQSYFENLPFSDIELNKLHIFSFAFEFEGLDIKKINMYYRNKF